MLDQDYDTPAPGRECGSCTLCCKVYDIHEIRKPEGRWCQHCTPGRGCRIHEDRPYQCREFFCLWLTDADIPMDWKPEHSKVVLSIFPENGFIYGQVDPGSPHAWRKEPYFSELKRLSASLLKQNRHLILFVNREATLIMPTGAVPMGPMSPLDGFVVRQVFTDAGPGYEVERVPQGLIR